MSGLLLVAAFTNGTQHAPLAVPARLPAAPLVVYARDKGAGTEIAFSRQASGCSLTRRGYSVTGVKTPAADQPGSLS